MSDPIEAKVLAAFRQTGALLEGHFVLRSGLHSRQFFQCALLLQHAELAAQLCGDLAAKVRALNLTCDAVVSLMLRLPRPLRLAPSFRPGGGTQSAVRVS